MIFGQTIHWASAGLSLVFGYLLGSIPFGLIFAWLAGAGDVRKIGSGNIGATNVLRTGKRWAAIATLVFDAGKGAAAVLIAAAFYGQVGAVFAALGAFLGHLFPVWLGFKGGKGGATALGVALALAWPAALAAAATWLLVAVISRISSLATLTTALLAPLYMYFLSGPLTALLAIILGVLMFVMHRANIARLLSGTEPRIGAKKAP
jgi:glycerol-3-phosphate acyltransferase PlsY